MVVLLSDTHYVAPDIQEGRSFLHLGYELVERSQKIVPNLETVECKINEMWFSVNTLLTYCSNKKYHKQFFLIALCA